MKVIDITVRSFRLLGTYKVRADFTEGWEISIINLAVDSGMSFSTRLSDGELSSLISSMLTDGIGFTMISTNSLNEKLRNAPASIRPII